MQWRYRTRNGWTPGHALGAVAMAAAGAAVTRDAWADIFYIARRDEESRHIFLVPVVVAWLLWVRRQRIRSCVPRAMFIGPAVAAVGWFLYSYGDAQLIQSFWHFGAVLVLTGCALSVLGADVLRKFLPAFAALVFLVPVPAVIRHTIAIPLQTVTAQAAQVVVSLLEMPVERSGNLLMVNGVNVAIAEACNGLRMVFNLALVSFAFAFGTPLRPYARALIVAASPLSAILCNVILLVPTIWLYGSRPVSVADRFHDFSGWIMLPIAFVILLGIIRALRWALIPVTRYTLAYD